MPTVRPSPLPGVPTFSPSSSILAAFTVTQTVTNISSSTWISNPAIQTMFVNAVAQSMPGISPSQIQVTSCSSFASSTFALLSAATMPQVSVAYSVQFNYATLGYSSVTTAMSSLQAALSTAVSPSGTFTPLLESMARNSKVSALYFASSSSMTMGPIIMISASPTIMPSSSSFFTSAAAAATLNTPLIAGVSVVAFLIFAGLFFLYLWNKRLKTSSAIAKQNDNRISLGDLYAPSTRSAQVDEVITNPLSINNSQLQRPNPSNVRRQSQLSASSSSANYQQDPNTLPQSSQYPTQLSNPLSNRRQSQSNPLANPMAARRQSQLSAAAASSSSAALGVPSRSYQDPNTGTLPRLPREPALDARRRQSQLPVSVPSTTTRTQQKQDFNDNYNL